jgi:hypothetical protein
MRNLLLKLAVAWLLVAPGGAMAQSAATCSSLGFTPVFGATKVACLNGCLSEMNTAIRDKCNGNPATMGACTKDVQACRKSCEQTCYAGPTSP